MECEPGTSDEGEASGTTAETENATTDATSTPTICFVCQQPISERTAELPRGEPAHPDCAAERRDALSQRTPSVE